MRYALNTQQIMWLVCATLLPGTAAMSWLYGIGIWWNLAWLIVFCVLVEVSCQLLSGRNQGLRNSLSDGTTWVSAWLMAICLPPMTTMWVLGVASMAAIALAKHAYGGTGRNVFNPAMVGYAVVLVSFPQQLMHWPQAAVDGLTGATLLSEFKYRTGLTMNEFASLYSEQMNQQTIVALAFAAGGVVLLYMKVIAWRIPLAVFAGVALAALLGYDGGSSSSLGSVWFHITTGGLVAGAFFVATDPVTHPSSARGQWLFGIVVGVLTYLIRGLGSFPDGFAFAILLGNCATPLLNRWHRHQLQATTPQAEQ